MPFTWLEIETFRQKPKVIEKNFRESRKLRKELASIEASRRKSIDKLHFGCLAYQKKLKAINDRIASNKSSSAAKYVVKDDEQRRDDSNVKSDEEIANRDGNSLQAENCVPRLDFMGSSKSEPSKGKGRLTDEPRLLRRGRASTFDGHGITNEDQNSSKNELQDVPYRNKSQSFTELSHGNRSNQDNSARVFDDNSSIEMDGKPLSMHSKGEGRKRNGTPHPKKLEELFLFDQQQANSDYEHGDFARISQRRFTIANHVFPHCSPPRGRSAKETQKACSSDLRVVSQSMLQSTGGDNVLSETSMGVDLKGHQRQRERGIQKWIQHEKVRENSSETINEMQSLDLPVIDEKTKLGRSRSKSLTPIMVQERPVKEREGIIGNPLRLQPENVFITSIGNENEHDADRRSCEAGAKQNGRWVDQRRRAKSLPVSDLSFGPDFLKGVANREKRCYSDASHYNSPPDTVEIYRLQNDDDSDLPTVFD